MKTKRPLLVFVLLIGLSACSYHVEVMTPAGSNSPTSTPLATETGMALASPTPPATEPVMTQEILGKPTDFSPVLYGGNRFGASSFLLLGGASKDAWLTPEESLARFSGEVTYSLSNMTTEAKYFLWGEMPEDSRTCNAYSVRSEAGLDESGFVAVVDSWTVTKRDVTELSPDLDLYQQAVIDWLKKEGVSDPQTGTLHVFRVDLEGDGSDEIFISATHLDDSQHTTKAGDHSIVLMRKVIGNEVVTKLVVGNVYASKEPEITFPTTYSLANFIDLNQDGILDVVVDVKAWEKTGAIVYEVNGQNVQAVLQTIC